jgi:hypothetical protein
MVSGRTLLGVLLAACIPAMAAAQSATTPTASSRISGVVRTESGPLRGAVVRIDAVARPTLTDSAGRFALVATGTSAYLHVRAVGIVPIDTIVQLHGGSLALTLVARRSGVRLDTSRVVAASGAKPERYANTGRLDEFYARRARSVGGVFLTRDSIERLKATGAVDLVRDVPGVRLERLVNGITVVRFPRCAGSAGPRVYEQADGGGRSVVQLFVDGTKAMEPFVTLSTISAADVEALEVYRSAAELPPEARGDGCAAIMIWTRHSVGDVAPPGTRTDQRSP